MQQIKLSVSKTLNLDSSSLIKNYLLIFSFTILTAVGAWLEIPTQPVPFTLQTFFVLLSGAVLGSRYGFISQIIYLLIGLIGIPVFAGFGAGLSKLIGPTGGYLLSFPIAAFVTGYLIQKKYNYAWTLFSCFAGLTIIYALGIIYLNTVYIKDWSISIKSGYLIFTWWDGLKVLAVSSIYMKINKFKNKLL